MAAKAGMSYEQLLVKNIAQPLAMSDTRLAVHAPQYFIRPAVQRHSSPGVKYGQSVSFVFGVSESLRNSTSEPSACSAICPLVAVHLVP